MILTFHGVRGSTPVSGPEFARTGGATSCVGVALAVDAPASLLLDVGTGAQRLGRQLGTQPYRGTILLTHLHWDHLFGLPFFRPADHPDAEVLLAQPAQGDPIERIEQVMSPPHFPIGPRELNGTWEHRALEVGGHRLGAYDVTAADVVHKGGRTFGYRIEAGGRAWCYVPDALDDNDAAIIGLARDVDLLVRGAPFVAAEAARAADFGHATIEHTIEVARAAGARRLIVTHHSPVRTDDDLDAIAARLGVELAFEGMTVEV